MIVSHRHRFIFLKTKKTAGTSIEIALSKFCGPGDIITPIWGEDETLRRQLGFRGPQNYLVPFTRYTRDDWVRLCKERRRKVAFYNHMPARDVKVLVGDAVWNSYYKFCFERNPWDRVISLYFWRYRSRTPPPIGEFLATPIPLLLKRAGYDLYTIGHQVAVDHIGRFENLADEMEAIRTRVGISEPLELPKAKARFRTDKRNYSEILSEAEKVKIAELFHDEIDLLGYRP